VIGVALFFLFTRQSVTPVKQALPEVTKPATIDVLVSTQNIDEGIELKAGLFRKETRPASDFVGVGVVSDFGQLSGAYAKSFVAAGQPLLAEHLTFRAPVNSVVPQIRVGYRAITIKLDKQTTNEGWARAGVRVDVLWASKQGTNSQAVIIAQNLRVLSSGASVSSEFGGESRMIQNSESTVTLEVSAEDQKRL
jgi:Flp pilus assembly protein CpaB